jgi:hypothetical protein
MRLTALILSVAVIAFSCKQKTEEHDHDHNPEAPDAIEQSANQMLYDEVMKIHDDVMPKLNDIHTQKQKLQQSLVSDPKMADEKKQAINSRISKLDSASEGMMEWMRKFAPIPDSLGEEKAREYLENEMVKVKKVREDILQALKEAEQN